MGNFSLGVLPRLYFPLIILLPPRLYEYPNSENNWKTRFLKIDYLLQIYYDTWKICLNFREIVAGKTGGGGGNFFAPRSMSFVPMPGMQNIRPLN